MEALDARLSFHQLELFPETGISGQWLDIPYAPRDLRDLLSFAEPRQSLSGDRKCVFLPS